MTGLAPPIDRWSLVARGLRLEYLTVGWNLVEGVIAISAALAAGSVALLGFGIDSFVESASAGILIWRLTAERRTTDHERMEAVEGRAQRLVALSLYGLAAYLLFDSAKTVIGQERPDPSVVGIGLTAVTVGFSRWLARAKRRAAIALGSRALQADAFQQSACWWLSLVTLTGLALNGALGWWWADPAAAIGMTYFLVREGREAWEGEDCCEA